MSKSDIAQELHRPARKNFVRRHVVVKGKNDLWECDLLEVIPFSKVNKGYKYIMVVIDCFTKFAWAIPLKTKTGNAVAEAMAGIFINRHPSFLHTDRGKEFYCTHFAKLMEKYDVKHYSTFSTVKCSFAERFIRTIKTNIYREFTARGNRKWFLFLDEIMKKYNNSIHSSISMTPTQADENPSAVKIKHRKRSVKSKIKFKVGQKVRISGFKSIFTKGYIESWTCELFTIVKVNNTTPVTYLLEDCTGAPILGGFYQEELQLTRYPDSYLIEKVIKRKKTQMYVKWYGFDNSHNSWISSKDVEG